MLNRKRLTKVNSSDSNFEEIITGIPQRFILVPQLFKVRIFDLFYDFDTLGMASYADDNTPYNTLLFTARCSLEKTTELHS